MELERMCCDVASGQKLMGDLVLGIFLGAQKSLLLLVFLVWALHAEPNLAPSSLYAHERLRGGDIEKEASEAKDAGESTDDDDDDDDDDEDVDDDDDDYSGDDGGDGDSDDEVEANGDGGHGHGGDDDDEDDDDDDDNDDDDDDDDDIDDEDEDSDDEEEGNRPSKKKK